MRTRLSAWAAHSFPSSDVKPLLNQFYKSFPSTLCKLLCFPESIRCPTTGDLADSPAWRWNNNFSISNAYENLMQASWELVPPIGRLFGSSLFLKEFGRATIAGIFRDNSGSWPHGFNRAIGVADPLQSELWAIHDDLHLAWHLGYEFVQVQSDCSRAISMLNAVVPLRSSSPLDRAIIMLQQRAWAVEFVWIPREANSTTDALAKTTPQSSFELTHHKSPPALLHDLLHRDRDGPPYWNIFAFGLFVSPMYVLLAKNQSTESFSGLPYVYALLNCLICTWYGTPSVSYDNVPVMTVNSIVFGLMAIIVAGSLQIADRGTRWVFIGLLSCASLISMFASPLFIINLVIRTKSVEFMPFYLSLSTFLMSTSFFLYGVFNFDAFIYVPNGIGTVLGILQLALYFHYKTKCIEECREPLMVSHA
ncbi:Bidirectional sugar transporter SWEET2a [Hibiscus syriacus]|uniref:Bidirectional sugar transporter SWEET2a n=1 Tax=Hibiscus syriacus TaxID=106335 RepID=A0A6A2YK09_HIBSY|nr:Bidirectional sugar transporter SWEET2a [Hibiscus syriacus]